MSIENIALNFKRDVYKEIAKLDSLFEWGKCIVDGKPLIKIDTPFEYNGDTEAIVISFTDTGEEYTLGVTSTLTELESTLIEMCDDIPEILNNKRNTLGVANLHPSLCEEHLKTILETLESNLDLDEAVFKTVIKAGFKHIETIEYNDDIKTLTCLEFHPGMIQPVLTIYSDIVSLNAIKIDKSHLAN